MFAALGIRNAKCGKIQCQSSASKPVESNAVAIDTTIKLNGREIHCRGTHVYLNEEDEGDILDPGLVMTGTKCGDSHVCFEGHCQNTSFFESGDCGKKCNGHGTCNNNHNCHCFSGWAPPFCDKPGKGGSLDSGPMLEKNPIPIIIGVLVSILLLTLIGLAFCCYKWRAKLVPIKKIIFTSKKTQQSSPPLSIQKEVDGHANPTFKSKTPQGQRKITDIRNIPSKPEVLYCQPPAEFKRQEQPPPPVFPANYTKKPLFLEHQTEEKHLPKRTPPSRPAPPPPNVMVQQDSSRLRPPQRALPANPVSSSKRMGLSKVNTGTVPSYGTARNTGIHAVLAENRAMRNPGAAHTLKFRN